MDFPVALQADKGNILRRVRPAKRNRLDVVQLEILRSLYATVAHGAFIAHSFQYFIAHPTILDSIGISSPGQRMALPASPALHHVSRGSVKLTPAPDTFFPDYDDARSLGKAVGTDYVCRGILFEDNAAFFTWSIFFSVVCPTSDAENLPCVLG